MELYGVINQLSDRLGARHCSKCSNFSCLSHFSKSFFLHGLGIYNDTMKILSTSFGDPRPHVFWELTVLEISFVYLKNGALMDPEFWVIVLFNHFTLGVTSAKFTFGHQRYQRHPKLGRQMVKNLELQSSLAIVTWIFILITTWASKNSKVDWFWNRHYMGLYYLVWWGLWYAIGKPVNQPVFHEMGKGCIFWRLT